MKLRNITKDSLFTKSLKLAKSNPNKAGLMILFDILFIVTIFILFRLSTYFAQVLVMPQTTAAIPIAIILSLTYYLMILFAYSFFKYCILDFIKSLFSKTSFSFNQLGQFYMLNIIIAGIFFAITIALNAILASIKQSYAPFVFIVLAVPYALFLYIIINISHSLFYKGDSIKDATKKSFSIIFTKIKIYREIILIMILFAISLSILFFGIGYLINLLASKNYNLYLSIYSYFKQASIIIFDLIFYFIILINRISFYSIAKEIT